MKKKWIVCGVIALLLITSIFIILICWANPVSNPNKEDPSIEIPVEPPETPDIPNIPVEPTNPEVPEENEKDDEKNDNTDNDGDTDSGEDANGGEDVDNEQDTDDNQDEEENVIVGVEIPFTFKEGVLTGYKGDETEITLPTSYRFAGTRTVKTVFESADELYNWCLNQRRDYWNFRITIKLANGEDYVVRDIFFIYHELSEMSGAFPATYVEEVEVFVEGDDIQVTTIGENAFSGSQLTKVVIPDCITEIESGAFNYCVNLTDVEFSNNLVKIGDYAFSGCSNLTEINLPNSLVEIGQSGFQHCTSLQDFILPDSVTTLGYLAFADCTSLENAYLPKNAVNLGYCIFERCSGLRTARVESNVEVLAGEIFAFCVNLTDVELPEGITKIEFCMFYGCTSLRSIKIPESVVELDERIFYECTSLVELDLPENLTTIIISDPYYQCGLVYGCSSLERIIIRSKTQVDLTELYKSYKKGTYFEIYVPDDLLEQYQIQYPELDLHAISEHE